MSRHYHHKNQVFEEFENSSREDWIERIRLEFPGKKSDNILSGKIREELAIFPFYTPEDLPASLPLLTRLKPENSWSYHQIIQLHRYSNFRELNALILNALNAGASGVDFYGTGHIQPDHINFSDLLTQAQLQHYGVSFYLDSASLSWFDLFLDYAESLGLKEKITGTLFLQTDFENPEYRESKFDDIANLFSKDLSSAYRLLGISSAPFADQGASVVQELAYALSLLVGYLDVFTDQGMDVFRLLQQVEISLSTRTDYFIEIAKFRACRWLLSQIAAAYHSKDIHAYSWKIKGTSGRWNKTVYDPMGNLLRNTTEALAAVIGGCNTVAILPHDNAQQGSGIFGGRMARNISHILALEAHIGRVDDPAAGSFFFESLTQQLSTKVWQEFLSIEKEGGFMAAVKKGIIQQRIERYRASRQDDIKTRRQVFVGATRYIDSQEFLDPQSLDDEEILMNLDGRGPAQFEFLRLKVDHEVKKGNPRPIVGLGVFPGTKEVALINARIAFVKDLLASVGIETKEVIFEEVHGFRKKDIKSRVWVLCGHDDFYDHHLPEWLQESLLFCDKILWLAGKPLAPSAHFQRLGIQGFIYAGAQVQQILKDILTQLGIEI